MYEVTGILLIFSISSNYIIFSNNIKYLILIDVLEISKEKNNTNE